MARNIEFTFPNLASSGYQITSPETNKYNCIAWAAEDIDNWWWPDYDGYWPLQIPEYETIDSFISAYALTGYVLCDNPLPENGYQKIAIYIDNNGIPTHAARMLHSGKWTSKLGRGVDIEHNTLEALHGNFYGRVSVILRRPISQLLGG